MSDPARLYERLTAAFNARDWLQARTLAAQLLPYAAGHAGVHYIAGIAELELHQLPLALAHLQHAADLAPQRAEVVVQLAKALVLARRNPAARAAADQVLALAPSDPAVLDTLGVIYTQLGQYVPAFEAFHRAVALAPERASYRYNFATALIAGGQPRAAEDELEACLARDPHYWMAHLTLAQVRHQSAQHHHLQRLEALLAQVRNAPADAHASMCLHMALAKEYEDLADYPAAFSHLVRGKAAGGATQSYASAQDTALFAAIESACPRIVDEPVGCPSNEPIFVIGMPRSGTTLVERILSSHPDVHSAGELLNFGMTLKTLTGRRGPALIDLPTIAGARELDWRALGAAYLASTRPATGHTARFIDKLPHNFLYAGFIARALPQAKIICLRRDPLDVCLSNFRQLFAPGSAYFGYSFNLLDIGRYYILFDRLMAHWQRALPGRVLEVDYETLVDAQEATTRRLLAFCDLPWDDACLHFERNPAPVVTASAVQVRAPIYRSAIGRWKNYASELHELRDLLTGAGIKLVT